MYMYVCYDYMIMIFDSKKLFCYPTENYSTTIYSRLKIFEPFSPFPGQL